jgi:hypothetical protein
MTEAVQKIKTTIAELEDELRSLPSLDEETRQVLEDAVREIQAALGPEESDVLQQHSLMERLSSTAQEFEDSHPTLTGIVTRLIDGLGQMGI